MQLWRMKLKAFTIHLLLSVFIISLFLLVVTQFWYPGLLFNLENVWQGLEILIPVDAILGPVLTLILFAPGKKNLKLDLSVIALIQIGALFYGGMLIYQQRPVALAFVVDRFETVLANEDYVKDIRLKKANSPFSPSLSYVLPAQSDKERTRMLIEGTNIKAIGKRHVPITPNIAAIKKASLKPSSLTHISEHEKRRLEEFIQQNESRKELLLFPVQSSTYDAAILVFNINTEEVVQYLDIYPWVKP